MASEPLSPLLRTFSALKVNKIGGWCLDHRMTRAGEWLCRMATRLLDGEE